MSAHMISPQQAHEWLVSGQAVLIDVREPEEFGVEHIACATSVPLSLVPGLFDQMKIPPERKIIFQCLKGGRGQQACVALSSHDVGQYDVYNIEGGIHAWKAAGLPVIGAVSGPALSIFRQVQIIVGAMVALFVLLGFLGLTLGFIVAGLLGGALFIAGVTGWCGLAMLLRRMPWNR